MVITKTGAIDDGTRFRTIVRGDKRQTIREVAEEMGLSPEHLNTLVNKFIKGKMTFDEVFSVETKSPEVPRSNGTGVKW